MKYLILLIAVVFVGCSATKTEESQLESTGFNRLENPHEYDLVLFRIENPDLGKTDPDNPKYKYWWVVKKHKIKLYQHIIYYYFRYSSGAEIGVQADCISENKILTEKEKKIIREKAKEYLEEKFKHFKEKLKEEKKKPKRKEKTKSKYVVKSDERIKFLVN